MLLNDYSLFFLDDLDAQLSTPPTLESLAKRFSATYMDTKQWPQVKIISSMILLFFTHRCSKTMPSWRQLHLSGEVGRYHLD